MVDMGASAQALNENGYVVIPGLLEGEVVEALHARSQAILADLPVEHRERNRSQGSLVPLADHPAFADVIGSPALRAAFTAFGFPDPRFSSGYLISKPPGGPPLFWHQDWWGWDDPISYTPQIAQIFVMIYLSDTSSENGCLRVIPGSHRRHHPLHDAPAAHGEALSRVDDPNHPLYGRIEGEIDVPVMAGDVVFGDARILHAAHGNGSDAERSLLTLWYHPDYRSLPAGMRARIRGLFDRQGADTDVADADALTLEDWPDAPGLRDLFPSAETAKPHEWCRVPDWTRAPTTAA